MLSKKYFKKFFGHLVFKIFEPRVEVFYVFLSRNKALFLG